MIPAQPSDEAALFLGVNRAVGFRECDYWVALDWKSFSDVEPMGNPQKITAETSAKKEQHEFSKIYKHKDPNEGLPPVNMQWTCYSTLCAIVAAYDMGCREINIYGADMAGVEDWDSGQVARAIRTESRWERERKYFFELCRWMSEHGASVRRVNNGDTVL
jgi:hypothetical protein